MRYVGQLGLLVLLLISGPTKAEVSCLDHKIYCAIMTLRPDISRNFAMELSNYIHKYAKQYNTDPLRSVAIAMQESSITNVNRKQDIILIRENCSEENVCTEFTQVVTGYTDIGLWQFHAKTIQAYGMSALRLRDDLEYATQQHVILLRAKIRECGADLGDKSWVCYHSKTPKYRKKYFKAVERYYKQITNIGVLK